jgi:spore germination protein GerM
MRRRLKSPGSLILIGLAMALALGTGWFLAMRSLQGRALPPATLLPTPAVTGQRVVAHLYFGNPRDRSLSSEQRPVDRPDDAAGYARQLIDLLIEGPQQGGGRTLPETARLRALFVAGDGVAYVDFSDDAFEQHPGGVGSELITLYSVVNTLVLNIEEIRCVKLLIGGRQAVTLAGHVDLAPVHKAAMLWIR